MNKYLSIAPIYFIKEGFGTLMSHFALMYCINKDLKFIPTIIDFNSISQSTMQSFNYNNESIIYHDKAFKNFSKYFSKVNINNIQWKYKDFSYYNYHEIIQSLKNQDNGIFCTWTLNHQLYKHYLDDIITELYVFNDDILNLSKQILPKTNSEIVGICVRHEYAKTTHYPHISLSMNFYEESMKKFDKKISKYLIFSDDIELSKIMFKNLENNFDIEYTKPMQSVVGLCVLSLCDHIICANSSFSYWASLLNKNPHKIIICPQKFIDEKRDRKLANLLNYNWYPESWMALPVI